MSLLQLWNVLLPKEPHGGSALPALQRNLPRCTGQCPTASGRQLGARAVICRMLANYSRTGVSREGQTDVHTSIFSAGDGNFRQGMEIITKAGHSSETEGTLKKGARSEQLTWNIFARHWCISEPGSTNMGKDDKRREDGGWG